MRVAMISDWEQRGGAAIAATRLADGLSQLGHDVHRLVAERSPDAGFPSRVRKVGPTRGVRAGLERLPQRWRVDMAARTWVNRAIHEQLTHVKPDVISVHNLHGAFRSGWSIEVLELADAMAPTLWTLHDMWSFTGRCAYSYGCELYINGCDARCPTPHEYPKLPPTRIAGEWRARKRVLAKLARTYAVAPSAWLGRSAERGLWGDRVRVVPYGLPLDIFRPHDRALARESLGIPNDRPVLLVAAQNLGDRRKGATQLAAALTHVPIPVTVVCMGAGDLPPSTGTPGVRIVRLGTVESQSTQALAYGAADVFVHPALADNLPLVVQEAISSGTPVVSFDVGGLSDLVRPGVTGWLAEPGPESMARTIVQALEEAHDLRVTCRRVAEDEWDLLTQAQRYEQLWQRLDGFAHSD